MKVILVLLMYTWVISEANSKRKTHGYRARVYAAKRSKYYEEGPAAHKYPSAATSERYNGDVIDNYATENTPIFWKDIDDNDIKRPLKRTEEDASVGGFEVGQDQLPNTVGPNENIYGGFPVNDVLGGFELPSPETLAILKAALKKFGPRNEYEAELHHDIQNWAYGYEHHALPEYDVKETPPFYITMLEGLKMAEEGKKKPSCEHQEGGCGITNPVFHLNDDQCNVLAGNCMPSKPVTSGYEEPCPWRIIEMLFGCKKPAKPPSQPAEEGKPDAAEPKPDAPEKPPEEQAGNEEEKKPKPKPIPIQLEEGHATPGHIEKQVQDIKDEAKTSKGEMKTHNTGDQARKLQSQLGLLNFLAAASSKQDPQSRTEFSNPAKNLENNRPPDLKPGISVDTQAKQNSADEKTKEITNTSGNKVVVDKNEVDLSILPVPESIQIGSARKLHNNTNHKFSKQK